ncbi:MAG TPA: putative metal-dependent hydrolase [Longimicrobiales bacterium]|nr:putative metal-dependent hydrolase [Longimicrobiales bacterium]
MPLSDDQLETLRFPTGRFAARSVFTAEERAACIEELDRLPAQIRAAVSGLGDEDLDTPYRPGGWTIRQVVHHLPDSHMNAYIRCKLAVTSEAPVITGYDEAAWAELADGAGGDIEPSLALLEGLHSRWAAFLRSLDDRSLDRTYLHPEMGPVSVATAIQLYAWHGRHHLGHIMNALAAMPRPVVR